MGLYFSRKFNIAPTKFKDVPVPKGSIYDEYIGWMDVVSAVYTYEGKEPVILFPETQKFTEDERIVVFEKFTKTRVQDGFVTEDILELAAEQSHILVVEFDVLASNLTAFRKKRYLFDGIYLYGRRPPKELYNKILNAAFV